MIYLLFLLLLILLIMAYLTSGRMILSPTFIVAGVFLLSTSFAILQSGKWGVSLDPLTVSVIMLGLLAFWAGELVVTAGLPRKRLPDTLAFRRETKTEVISIPPVVVLAISAVLAGMFVFYLLDILRLAALKGPHETSSFLGQAKDAIVDGHKMNRLATQFSVIAECCSLVMMYAFLNNCMASGKKARWLYLLLPTVIQCAFLFAAFKRSGYIELVAAFTVMLIVLGHKHGKLKLAGDTKLLALLGVVVVLFFGLFILLGILAGPNYGDNPLDKIAQYIGMSIPSLDHFLQNPPAPSRYVGEHSFTSLYSVLQTLGVVDAPAGRYLESVVFGGDRGNVYTALRRYIQDFSYVGMLIIMFTQGLTYRAFLQKAMRHTGVWLIFYAVFAYALFMMSIDDLFLSFLVGTSTIYKLVYIPLFFYLLAARPRYRLRYTRRLTLGQEIPYEAE